MALRCSGGAAEIASLVPATADLDMSDEFAKMIVTQRDYCTDVRVISRMYEILDEIVRISG